MLSGLDHVVVTETLVPKFTAQTLNVSESVLLVSLLLGVGTDPL